MKRKPGKGGRAWKENKAGKMGFWEQGIELLARHFQWGDRLFFLWDLPTRERYVGVGQSPDTEHPAKIFEEHRRWLCHPQKGTETDRFWPTAICFCCVWWNKRCVGWCSLLVFAGWLVKEKSFLMVESGSEAKGKAEAHLSNHLKPAKSDDRIAIKLLKWYLPSLHLSVARFSPTPK